MFGTRSRVALARAAGESNQRGFASLDPDFLRMIFGLLPLEERTACVAVCRAWRSALRAPDLWRVIRLSQEFKASSGARWEAVLSRALCVAGADLRDLSILFSLEGAEWATVLQLVQRVAPNLRVLDVGDLQVDPPFFGTVPSRSNVDALAAYLGAAPRLEELRCRAYGNNANSGPMLRCEPPWGALRMKTFSMFPPGRALDAVLRDVSAHTSLEELRVWCVDFDEGETMVRLSDVLGRPDSRVKKLRLEDCVAQTSMPFLALGTTLLQLHMYECSSDMLDTSLGRAIQSSNLTSLKLLEMDLLRPTTSRHFIPMLAGHATLQDLDLWQASDLDFAATEAEEAELGNSLAAVIAADAPSLTRFAVHCMSEAVMRIAIRALDCNSHLQEVFITTEQRGSAALVQEALDAGARLEQRTGRKDVLRWIWDEPE